ncbi:MAG TPA: c-type cytochrome [Balneolaceae bacterium]|nr:c-type cytochrome [Balneolaceae bacterium]
MTLKPVTFILLASAFLLSCRGQSTEKPPIRHHFNMVFQDRFNAQEENPFFDDNMAMRLPVEGTVARGNLRLESDIYEGVDENGEFVTEIPFELTRDFLYRGQDRYDVYCQVCHGGIGNGQGVIMTGGYGYVPAPTFHRPESYNMPDGEFYSAITHGIRTMPSYASQINVEDRWAIVAYIRALQQSQNVPESDMHLYDVDLAELQQQHQAEQEKLEELAEARESASGGEVSAERGEALFTQNACGTCHSVEGASLVGPPLNGLYGSEQTFTDGTSAIADEEYLHESIVNPSAKVVEGYQNAMVPYDFLSEDDIQSIIEYIKSLSDE